MKKTLALMLAIMMLLGLTCTASAYDEEITFQGIPWGANGDETLQILQNEKGIIDVSSFVSNLTVSSILEESGGFAPFVWPENDNDIYQAETYSYQDFPYKDSVSAVLVDEWNIKKTVGGFAPWGIKFSFLNKGNDVYELSSVVISYNTDDKKDTANQIYNELLDKLTSLYGEPQEHSIKEKYTGADFCVWHGINDTGIALVSSYISHSGGFYNVNLIYGKTDDIFSVDNSLSLTKQSSPQNSVKEDSGL